MEVLRFRRARRLWLRPTIRICPDHVRPPVP